MVTVPVQLSEFTNTERDIPMFRAHDVLRYVWDEVGLKVSSSAVREYWAKAKERGVPWAQKDYSEEPGGWPIPLKIFGDDATFNQHPGIPGTCI